MQQTDNAKKYQQLRLLETVVRVKKAHVSDLCTQALEHARLANELHSREHAMRAQRLRESIRCWESKIEKNRAEIARLKDGITD